MQISLSPETQKLLDERLKKSGYTDPDALVRFALENLEQLDGGYIEDLDEETQASIERGIAELDRGESRSLEEVKAEFKAKFGVS